MLVSTATSQTHQIPSKWDIIPLHTSDRATFKDCRRKWFWSSPAHSNLIPKASVHGIYPPFWFGTGIHYALQHNYNPVLKQDPETAFDTWFHIQWEGGEVKEDELEHFSDRLPSQLPNGKWYVRGLRDVLPLPDTEEFEMLHDLGKGMMRYYKEYSEAEDNFRVVASEHQFSVPILDPHTGKPLYMPDTREMPEDWEPSKEENEFGPLTIPQIDGADIFQPLPCLKQVHARGRMDLIVQGNDTGNYVIIDHKTSEYALDDDYFAHTDLDEQCTTYIWAAELEAKLYDLEYKNIAGIIYQGLKKAYPRPPTILKNGTPSINRQTESTTVELFDACINELGLKNYFINDEKMQAYYNYLMEAGPKQFIRRWPVTRNKHQKDNAGLRIYMEALDMLDNPRIYPNPTKNYTCLKCRFRGPCLAVESGFDYESMIEDGYEMNFDR